MTATTHLIQLKKKAFSKRQAERLFKEYVWSATGRFEECDLPYYENAIVVDQSTVNHLFSLSREQYFSTQSGVEYTYLDVDPDGQDAVIITAIDENGNELGELKFIAA